MWATLEIKPIYKDENGATITRDHIRDSVENAAYNVGIYKARRTFETMKKNITARAESVEIYDEQNGRAVFPCIYAALKYIHEKKIKYLFCADGVRDFSFFDYIILTSKKWKRAEEKKDNAAKNGFYKKITGWNFSELSGEKGQRYILRLWTVYKDSHYRKVTRGTALYDFSNFFAGDVLKLAKDFGVIPSAYSVQTLYNVIKAYAEALEKVTGEKFLQDDKPAAMTAGGIAKRALLFEMYGGEYKYNLKAFKRDHPITPDFDRYLYETRLMRGGTCWQNGTYKNEPIKNPVYKIDRNSSYTKEAEDMPDLCGDVSAVDIKEYFNPLNGYEYFCTVEGLKMRARKNMPAVFFDPWIGRNPRNISVYEKVTFFKQELDALTKFYDIEYINIIAAFRIVKRENVGFKRYAQKMYNGKAEAKAKGEPALYAVFKSLNVCAWGKLAQRADFPTVEHKLSKDTGEIISIVRPPDPEAARPALSVICGAYITMRARLALWETALKCGGDNPDKNILYMDSDSVHTFEPIPETVKIGTACGEWKDESGNGGAVLSLYADRKAYFNIMSESPFEVVEHVRGIPTESIKRRREQRKKTHAEESDGDAETYIFKSNAVFVCPVNCVLKGGRGILYNAQRMLSANRITSEKDRKTIYNGKNFIEI